MRPKRDKHGSLRLDPYQRPLFSLRRFDWVVSGILETVRVFGDSAPERQQLNRIEETLSQRDLPFVA